MQCTFVLIYFFSELVKSGCCLRSSEDGESSIARSDSDSWELLSINALQNGLPKMGAGAADGQNKKLKIKKRANSGHTGTKFWLCLLAVVANVSFAVLLQLGFFRLLLGRWGYLPTQAFEADDGKEEVLWSIPEQGEIDAKDEVEWAKTRPEWEPAALAMADFLKPKAAEVEKEDDESWLQTCLAFLKADTDVYLKIRPGYKALISHPYAEPPHHVDEFPGTVMWQFVTPHRWKVSLLCFGVHSGLEAMDLQSDLTMMTSLVMDPIYEHVPKSLKFTVVALTVSSVSLEFIMATYLVMKNVKESSKNREVCVDVMLNYLATPVQLMVAPLRHGPFGTTGIGRNIGYTLRQRIPLVLRGPTALVPYLRNRTYLVRVPKVIIENVILFVLLCYIQDAYIGEWTGAFLFSTLFSMISLLNASSKVTRFLLDARAARRYLKKTRDDNEGLVGRRLKEFANSELKQWPLNCPLL